MKCAVLLSMVGVGYLAFQRFATRKRAAFAVDCLQLDIAAYASARGLIVDGTEPEWARKRLAEGYRSLK